MFKSAGKVVIKTAAICALQRSEWTHPSFDMSYQLMTISKAQWALDSDRRPILAPPDRIASHQPAN